MWVEKKLFISIKNFKNSLPVKNSGTFGIDKTYQIDMSDKKLYFFDKINFLFFYVKN